MSALFSNRCTQSSGIRIESQTMRIALLGISVILLGLAGFSAGICTNVMLEVVGAPLGNGFRNMVSNSCQGFRPVLQQKTNLCGQI